MIDLRLERDGPFRLQFQLFEKIFELKLDATDAVFQLY